MLEQKADPFADLGALRISQDFAEGLGVKKLIIRIPVRKPDRQVFFRVHSDPDYCLETMVVELKEDRETFLVMPGIRDLIFDEVKPVRLYTVIDRQGNVSLWPCKLPTAGGRANAWSDSAIDIAELAKAEWMRLTSNMALSCYEPMQAMADLPDPEWPDKTFQELLRIAFKGKTIDDLDHPVDPATSGPELIPDHYREAWAVDFEYHVAQGDRPTPLCIVARELRSGRLVRQWLRPGTPPPFNTGPDVLFVAWYASAELGCYLALGWPMPERVLDLFAEFLNLTNGLPKPCGNGLLGALVYYGLSSIGAEEKKQWRDVAIRGGPFTPEEEAGLVDYCQTDVDATARLAEVMLPKLQKRPGDFERALLRGRYMAAVARMEHTGTPIDGPTLERLRDHWEGLQEHLITEIDADFGVYDGRTFKYDRFADYLARHDLPWPRLPGSERLDLSGDAFREMARAFPQVAPLKELRHSMGELRLNALAVGADGRNRCLLSPFGARTSRNQPSNSKFIFGPSAWLRSLIKPKHGRTIAYIDWSQQEIGIAAALSSDEALLDAVKSGDPYLSFAIQAGLAPDGATKSSHGYLRDMCKAAVLGVNYGMGEQSLADRTGKTAVEARDLLRRHRATYPTFWRWSDAAVDRFSLHGRLEATFGWRIHAGSEFNARSVRNFPMQANGAEMLRLACSLATERGVEVCCPVHDAIMIEADVGDFDDKLAAARAAMAEASRIVLGGFELGTDAKAVGWPHRYADQRGEVMWSRVMGILDRLEGVRAAA